MQVDHLGHILQLNTHCAEIFGHDVADLLHKPFDLLLPPAMRDRHAGLFNSFVRSSEGRMMGQGTGQKHFPAIHKNGYEITVQIGLNIKRDGEHPIVILAIADVTDRARLLAELRHGNERLRHKTKELMLVVRQQNHFLNVVSHELRTPLHNSLETLNQLSATQLDEDQAELFQDLDKANIDVTRSVKMLMDYADSMLGELHLEEEEFDLRALWLDRLRLVQRAHPGQIHLVQIHEEFDFDPLILGDKMRLGRMMHGLIDNALKFADANQITVQITFREHPEPHLRFEVCDDGVGMNESLLNAVGKPFANQSERRSRGGGGMGVGFFLTHKYLELMKGQFKLDSELGKGTCAGFTLPLNLMGKASAQSTLLPGTDELPLGSLKLMLVEDDPTVAKINALRLRKLGAQVIVLLQVPQQKTEPRKIYSKIMMFNEPDNKKLGEAVLNYSVSQSDHLKLQIFNRDFFDSIPKRSSLVFVNPDVAYCRQARCVLGTSERSYYQDLDHLNEWGAIELEGLLGDVLANAGVGRQMPM